MAEHLITEPDGAAVTYVEPDATKRYTKEEIEAMTKAEILALGTQLGYTMTTTEASTKEQIVADFMGRQTEAQE